MRWPWSSNTSNDDDTKNSTASKSRVSWSESLNRTDWRHFTEPQVIIPSVVFTITTLATIRLYKRYVRRIGSIDGIRKDAFRTRSIFGRVTSVGDGDNFRLYHTPGGRLMGWGWLRKVPERREQLSGKTLHVRIAGVDAPELAHFGRPAQPYGSEALEWLTQYLLHRQVRVHIYRRDQYDRVVASVFVRKGLFKKNVGLEMLKTGLATVYEAKFGSEFGGMEQEFKNAEQKARKAKLGIWSEPSFIQKILGAKTEDLETPRQYKQRMETAEKKLTAPLEAEKPQAAGKDAKSSMGKKTSGGKPGQKKN